MRSANFRAAPALLAATLAGCGVTLPWTDESSSSVGDGAFTVSPTALTFHGQAGGATPAAQRLLVTVGAESAYIHVAFDGAAADAVLVLDSATTAHVDVSVRAPQAAGEYHGTVTITGCADEVCTSEVEGSPVVVPVTYDVTGTDAPTALVASPATLVFQQAAGAPDPAPQTVALSQRGGGTSAWYTCIGTWDTPLTWLTFTPGSGTGLPVTIEVTVHGAGLPAGTTRSASFYYQTVPCGQTSPNTVRVPLTFTITP
jgi:hypothetical protein